MRVAITGASGNVGTSVLEALAGEPAVDSVLGIARRFLEWSAPKTDWMVADIRDADLTGLFAGCDAVVHLAWAIQPSHRQDELAEINVGGSRRVFEAARAAGVKALVHASSVGTYSPAIRSTSGTRTGSRSCRTSRVPSTSPQTRHSIPAPWRRRCKPAR